MKKSVAISLTLVAVLVLSMTPILAGTGESDGQDQLKNIKVGATNVLAGGRSEYMEQTATQAAKGKDAGEHLTGVFAGSVTGLRKGIHRVGAGAIELLTFWIPKKEPLITPEEPPVQ